MARKGTYQRMAFGTALLVVAAAALLVRANFPLQPADMLALPENHIDLAVAKLSMDKIIDPAIDIPANLQKLDAMAADVTRMVQPSATSNDKMLALMTYLYDPGPWNHYQPFSYNLDDPLGKDIKTKLLPNYLQTRKGNCVSMPTLLVILGRKIGLNMTLVMAPNHFFVHFIQDNGEPYNLEGVEKGTVSNERYQKEHYVSDAEIANGIYLKSLTKKQEVQAFLMVVANDYKENKQYDRAMDLIDMVLQQNPESVDAMLNKSSVYGAMGMDFLKSHNHKLTGEEDAHYQALGKKNNLWFAKAKARGWSEPPKDYNDQKYLAVIERAKARQKAEGEIRNAGQ